MRKPSDLKMYVNNQIKSLAEEVYKINSSNIIDADDSRIDILNAKLEVLFTIQKICEERKKY